MGPAINPEDVGGTGLLWLFLSYGYALFYAANMIGEGSELLLLVPSMAGLVGGVVLPLLGAVPDGAIILFSGLGSIEVAQENLSVGIGALAGSTIMLLTIPWAASVFYGRVDIVDGKASYSKKPKLTPNLKTKETLDATGVSISEPIQHGGIVMAATTAPYFLIQIPAMFMEGSSADIAKGEHWWSLSAFIICVVGLLAYLRLQLKLSDEGQDKDKRIAIAKKTLQDGKMSLRGIIKSTITDLESKNSKAGTDYGAINGTPITPEVRSILRELLHDAFRAYDTDNNGTLEKSEIKVFLKDFHENIDEDDVKDFLSRVDTDKNKVVTFDEFVVLCYHLITYDENTAGSEGPYIRAKSITKNVFSTEDDDEEDEAEEIPEELWDLEPEEQQKAIKVQAFKMLAIGTLMVVYFSDPMVDVMNEIAVRANIPPFYVSFVLAPLASNSSEVVASIFYAAKKTRKTMTLSFASLEGAACMNNTFCLSIFMGLIYMRGLAWQYTAETASIVIVQFIMAYLTQKKVMTTGVALLVLSIFPLSLVFVAALEAMGFD